MLKTETIQTEDGRIKTWAKVEDVYIEIWEYIGRSWLESEVYVLAESQVKEPDSGSKGLLITTNGCPIVIHQEDRWQN